MRQRQLGLMDKPILKSILDFHFTTWGKFHQPCGAKRKCTGGHSLAPVGAIQFHQQNCAQLHHYAQLKNTLNFYSVRPALYANKFSVNLMAKKLTVEC
jgi:hypothetical protein